MGIRSRQIVLKIDYVKNLTAVTCLSNWSLGVFSKQFSIKIVKYEDGMLILSQNDIFCVQQSPRHMYAIMGFYRRVLGLT